MINLKLKVTLIDATIPNNHKKIHSTVHHIHCLNDIKSIGVMLTNYYKNLGGK